MRRTLLILPLLVALVAFAAACGGSDESSDEAAAGATTAETEAVPATEWADTVCTSISDWQEELQANTPDFTNISDAEEAKQTIGDFLGTVATATRSMIDEVRAAGRPDVEQGEAIAQDFQNALAPVAESFDQARADVEALSTDDPAAFASEVTAIGATLTEAGNEAGAAFDEIEQKYPDAGIDETTAEVASCSELGG
jgi:hypothetical protein